ncbi:MAG: hypothetical protein EZS28_035001, partial [Streblomastix strix]
MRLQLSNNDAPTTTAEISKTRRRKHLFNYCLLQITTPQLKSPHFLFVDVKYKVPENPNPNPNPRKDPQQQPNEPKQVASAETQQTENKNKKNINDTPKKGDNGKIKETSKNQTTAKIYKNNELDE